MAAVAAFLKIAAVDGGAFGFGKGSMRVVHHAAAGAAGSARARERGVRGDAFGGVGAVGDADPFEGVSREDQARMPGR